MIDLSVSLSQDVGRKTVEAESITSDATGGTRGMSGAPVNHGVANEHGGRRTDSSLRHQDARRPSGDGFLGNGPSPPSTRAPKERGEIEAVEDDASRRQRLVRQHGERGARAAIRRALPECPRTAS